MGVYLFVRHSINHQIKNYLIFGEFKNPHRNRKLIEV